MGYRHVKGIYADLNKENSVIISVAKAEEKSVVAEEQQNSEDTGTVTSGETDVKNALKLIETDGENSETISEEESKQEEVVENEKPPVKKKVPTKKTKKS